MHGVQVATLETIANTKRESVQREATQQEVVNTPCNFISNVCPASIAASEAA